MRVEKICHLPLQLSSTLLPLCFAFSSVQTRPALTLFPATANSCFNHKKEKKTKNSMPRAQHQMANDREAKLTA